MCAGGGLLHADTVLEPAQQLLRYLVLVGYSSDKDVVKFNVRFIGVYMHMFDRTGVSLEGEPLGC